MTKSFAMLPAGYMAKRVVKRPDWVSAASVVDVYSVSGCVSENFADYVRYWRHNGYWLFDSADAIERIGREHSLALDDCTMFYYEIHDRQFDDDARKWTAFRPQTEFDTRVVPPAFKRLHGFDVVTFYAQTSPECSPLSCNALAGSLRTNEHCLFDSWREAVDCIEASAFDNSEPGPFRVFAVYTVDGG